jgi:hypothetical protein
MMLCAGWFFSKARLDNARMVQNRKAIVQYLGRCSLPQGCVVGIPESAACRFGGVRLTVEEKNRQCPESAQSGTNKEALNGGDVGRGEISPPGVFPRFELREHQASLSREPTGRHCLAMCDQPDICLKPQTPANRALRRIPAQSRITIPIEYPTSNCPAKFRGASFKRLYPK